jgi:hypothetical protein
MEQPEFLAWMEFYKLFPFDDLHRIHRPAALASIAGMSGDGIGGVVQKRIEWLQPDSRTAGMSDADRATLAAFGIHTKAK